MFNTELLPVQILYLQAPSKMKIEDALGFILKDLTLRRILNVQKINSFPTDRSKKKQKYFMFVRGEHYEGYDPQPFEKGLLGPLQEINQVQAKILTNFILRKYSMPSGFIGDKIFKPLRKQGYISTLPILKTFGYYNISRKAKEITRELTEFLNTQEQKLEELIDGDKGAFIEALNETGVYVFHFEKHNPALFKNVKSMVKRINHSKPLGIDHDLTNFTEAINIDLSYFIE